MDGDGDGSGGRVNLGGVGNERESDDGTKQGLGEKEKFGAHKI